MALGKGLSALIPEKVEDAGSEKVTYLETSRISRNSLQPRTKYDDDKLKELMASIKEKGILQPILVREKNGRHEVVAGERRLRAAQALNLEKIPVIIKNLTDQEALVVAIVENIQREELNPIEEAEAYRKLISDFEYTHESVAQSVGKDRSTISNLMRVLSLPADIQKGVADGEISLGHARALLSVEDREIQTLYYLQAVKKGLSVRELESLTRKKIKETPASVSIQTKNPQIEAVEDGLQKLLGTKIRITNKKKRGQIIIDYYSLEDLNRIVKMIIKQISEE